MEKRIKKFEEISIEEQQNVDGGWIGAAVEIGISIAGAFGIGFSFGYGAGSYDCDCPENDGRRLNEIGPTHNRA